MRPALVLGLVSLLGCPKLGDIKLPDTSQYRPKVTFKKLAVKNVTFDGVEADFVFRVENPNPVRLSLASFSYDLDLAGTDMLEGKQDEGFTLEAQGSSPLRLPVSVTFADAVSVVNGASGQDEVAFKIAGDMGFNTPIGPITIPYQEAGNFPIVRPPKFKMNKIRVAKLSLLKQTADIELDLTVTNDGAKPVGLGAFDYALHLGGTRIANGKVAELASAGSGSTPVTLPITVQLVDLGKSVVEAITKKTPVDARLKATMQVDTPFGKLPLNIDKKAELPVR